MKYHGVDPLSLGEESKPKHLLFGLFAVAQILAIAIAALVVIWLGVYGGGFAWTSELVFNFHPLFMILGLIVCYGEAILLYRVVLYVKKFPVKVAHSLVQLLALVFVAIAVTAIVTANGLSYRLYSIHSWLGVTTIALFALQWIIAFAIFLFPCATTDVRKALMPYHTALGLAIFVCAVGTVLMGITEQNMGDKNYDDLPTKQLLGNIISVLVVLFLGVCAYIITKKEWKRPAEHRP